MPETGRPRSGPNAVRLRRSVLGRLFATTLQGYLTLAATVFIVVAVSLVLKPDASLWLYLIAPAVLTALWLRGATAWARVEDDAVRWRYWTRWDRPWEAVTRVTLTRRAVFGHQGASGPPVIVVRSKGSDEDDITPARACGRHRREFGTAVLAAARAHGVSTEVVSTGWNEEPSRVAEPWE